MRQLKIYQNNRKRVRIQCNYEIESCPKYYHKMAISFWIEKIQSYGIHIFLFCIFISHHANNV